MDDLIYKKYKIIKNFEANEFVSIYIVEESVTGKKFAIKKIPGNTSNPLYNTAVKEFNTTPIDKKPNSPIIIDFFMENDTAYLLIDYKDEKSLKSVMSYPSIGKILNNRYLIIRGIACGGFGTVYLTRDLSLPGKYWAIKEMHEETGNTEIIERSFRVESEMLSTLEHPAIPRISDFFIEGKKLYLVMDYVKGETLKKMINSLQKGEHFPEDTVIKWALYLCDVLNYLHNRPTPIIFRDIKPDNIMITEQGELKLIDFGIARVCHINKNDTTQYALLTEGYAPQEQWLGKVDARSDIYSLGATIYHLLSGEHPKNIAPEFPPVEKFNPAISPVVSKILSKALELKPSDRFQNINDMKVEFQKVDSIKKVRIFLENARNYEDKGDFFNANLEYMKALELQGENYELLRAITICFENLDLKDKAIEYYNKILKLNLPEINKDEIKRKIKELSPSTDRRPTNTIPVKKEEEKSKRDSSTVNKIWQHLLIGGIVTIPVLFLFFIIIAAALIWIYKPFNFQEKSDYQFDKSWGSEGDGKSQFISPYGIAISPDGYVYVGDTGNNRIQKFTSSGEFISLWGSMGEDKGQFNKPQSLTIGTMGSIYVADTLNDRLQEFDSMGNFKDIWGAKETQDETFTQPYDITIGKEHIYVLNYLNCSVQKLNLNKELIKQWGKDGNKQEEFNNPCAINLDRDENIYVVDSGNNRIQKFDSQGNFLYQFGEEGKMKSQFQNPCDIAIDDKGDIFIVDNGNSRIQKLFPNGKFMTQWGTSGKEPGQFSDPHGIAIDINGNIYLADSGNNRIQVFMLK